MSLVMLLASTGSAKKVHTLGDSTMAPYDESATVTRGWGMYFGNFLTNGWTSINYAKGTVINNETAFFLVTLLEFDLQCVFR